MIRKPILVLIRLYQRILSPYLPATCRFYPSCSEYAAEAITQHGTLRGSILTVKRLSRCHPWHEGGHDPVDEQSGGSSWKNG